jgi:hypothetical protein
MSSKAAIAVCNAFASSVEITPVNCAITPSKHSISFHWQQIWLQDHNLLGWRLFSRYLLIRLPDCRKCVICKNTNQWIIRIAIF